MRVKSGTAWALRAAQRQTPNAKLQTKADARAGVLWRLKFEVWRLKFGRPQGRIALPYITTRDPHPHGLESPCHSPHRSTVTGVPTFTFWKMSDAISSGSRMQPCEAG